MQLYVQLTSSMMYVPLTFGVIKRFKNNSFTYIVFSLAALFVLDLCHMRLQYYHSAAVRP